jgi:hypothetical protein
MVLWSYGLMVLWSYGLMVLWSYTNNDLSEVTSWARFLALCPSLGRRINSCDWRCFAENGNGEFFPSLAKNYGPIAVAAGMVLQAEFDHWIEAIDRALSENTFFGSCNYVTYGMAKAG